MEKQKLFDLEEPKIQKEEILILKDKYFHPENVAIVTGAASGIGRATGVALAVNGLTVVGNDVNETGGKETAGLAEALGGKVIFIRTDLTKDDEIEQFVRRDQLDRRDSQSQADGQRGDSERLENRTRHNAPARAFCLVPKNNAKDADQPEWDQIDDRDLRKSAEELECNCQRAEKPPNDPTALAIAPVALHLVLEIEEPREVHRNRFERRVLNMRDCKAAQAKDKPGQECARHTQAGGPTEEVHPN